MLPSVTAPDVVQKRNEWLTNIDSYDPDTLVFLDESGVNIDMTRRYGRAINGDTAYTTYSGGTTGDVFVDYLENILIPTLHKGDIVIMDNLRSHHVKKVAEVLEKAEVKLLYLPPYSPDLNPIEKMWSKIKSILRKLKARTIQALPDAIDTAFSAVAPSDCIGWFKSCFVSC